MLRLSEKLYSPYDIMCRFLEKLPDGMTYDVLQSKVPALRRLKPKELDDLLAYTVEKDRVFVIPTERKGVAAAPLLRHKMYGAPTVVKESKPTKSENTVYVSAAGKAELQKPEVAKVETTAPETLRSDNSKDIKSLRAKHLDANMHSVATDIMAYLLNVPLGVTRTELGNAVVSYHRLRGANRQVVLSYLVAHEGVREVQPDKSTYRGAPKFTHPMYVQHLDKSEKPYDHSAPALSLDEITPLAEPAIKEARATNDAVPVRTAQVNVEESTVVSLAKIGDAIVELLEKTGEHLPMYELHDLVPAYHDLDDSERRECVQALVRSDRVRTYRMPNNNNGTLWIHLYEVDKNETFELRHKTAPVGENALAAAFKDAQDKAPMPELKPTPPVLNAKDFATLTEATPSADQQQQEVPASIPAAPVPPVNSLEIRAQIAQLTAMAAQLEQQEQNENLRAVLEPLRDAVVAEFDNVQTALSLQIDAVAALGVAVERFNTALGGK